MTIHNAIAAAINTVVPSILAFEAVGFQVEAISEELLQAVSPTGRYLAADLVQFLGLIKLVELRGWSWQAEDHQSIP